MKRLYLCLLVSAFAWTCHDAMAIGPVTGPVTFSLTTVEQGLDDFFTEDKTNTTAASSNVIVAVKFTETNAALDNADLLGLLGNSFNTNFPPKARLITDSSKFYVTDSTGSNVLLDVSAAMTLSNETPVETGYASESTRTTATSTNVSGIIVLGEAVASHIIYDDTAMTTHDGTHTQFHLEGILNLGVLSNPGTIRVRATLMFTHGTGAGTLRGHHKLLQGTFTSVVVGFESLF